MKSSYAATKHNMFDNKPKTAGNDMRPGFNSMTKSKFLKKENTDASDD